MLLVFHSSIADADINTLLATYPCIFLLAVFCNLLVMLSSGVDSKSSDF